MKRRWMILPVVLLLLGALVGVVTQRQATAGPPDLEGEHEQLVRIGSATCGVERWHVKTGIDSDARKVNVASISNTSIFHLRSLPAPSFLRVNTRIKPTETTVFRVTGYLLRFKEEADSDYHLVIADSGGRTMIAEIPAPDCVGSSSPFLSRIRIVRSQFDRRYTVSSSSWRRLKVAVTVTGVGFFDFKHGQSGVAPNAIELHPVLSLSYGKSSVSPPPLPPATSPPTKGGGFTLTAYVSPSTMSHNAYPTLYAKTVPGASCMASVVYSTGRRPVSFDGSARTVGSSGTISWTWHEETSGSGGTATVTCSYRGQSKSATASFSVS